MTDTTALVSATSVMLAAFGFFYNAVRDRLADARALARTTLPAENTARAAQARGAGRLALVLAVTALVPALVLLPALVDQVERAFDAGFDPGKYSTVRVVFAVLASTWWVLAGAMAIDAARHFGRARTLEA